MAIRMWGALVGSGQQGHQNPVIPKKLKPHKLKRSI